MKVKIGNKIYDAEEEPIMVILSKADKKNIASMLPEETKYCTFPNSYDEEKIDEFMELENK